MNKRNPIGTEPYRPSNGTEGEIFFHNWCARCTKEQIYQRTGRNPCMIWVHALAFNIGDPDYPKELVKDAGIYPGNPRCTRFRESGVARPKEAVKQRTVDRLPLFRSAQ